MMPHIFDMFTQVDRALERSRGGLGIGLTLVRRLVEMHGGTIEARSERGQGSEFSVRLPIAAHAADALPRPPARRASAADRPRSHPGGGRQPGRGAQPGDAARAWRATRRAPRTTATRRSPTAASFRPEVIPLDIGLPGLNGHDVARHIRAEPWGKNILLVAVTGWGQEEDRRRSDEAGFDAHLVKPIDPVVLETLLARRQRSAA